jgi:hypothetical protein
MSGHTLPPGTTRRLTLYWRVLLGVEVVLLVSVWVVVLRWPSVFLWVLAVTCTASTLSDFIPRGVIRLRHGGWPTGSWYWWRWLFTGTGWAAPLATFLLIERAQDRLSRSYTRRTVLPPEEE